MKNSFILLVAAFILSLSSQLQANEFIDKIAAVVDNNIIFESEVQKKLHQVLTSSNSKTSKINQNSLKEDVLENLILQRLQLNIAKRNNILVSEDEINSILKSTVDRLNSQGISFEQYLKNQNLVQDQVIEDIKKELTIKKIREAALEQRTQVTEQEIDSFLNSKEGKEWLTPRFHLAQIFLPHDKKSTSNTTDLAKNIYQQLQKTGSNFSLLAQKYSKGPNAKTGGDLGVRTKEELPEIFILNIAELNTGEITRPFSSDAGIHILKLVNRQGAKPVVINQYKVRHILVKVTDLFTNQEAQEKIQQLYNQIKNGKEFDQLANEHTDDIASKLNGGDLGWSLPGKFVSEFEQVMTNTAIGSISEPFNTPFGWHILQVDDIRQKDVFEQVKRLEVTKILKSRRFQDELRIWLQELRDNAIVEIRID